MNPKELFDAGKVKEAIEALIESVKKDPKDQGKRGFLVDLLCLTGDIERADKQLDTLEKLGGGQPNLVLTAYRQLMRGEMWRQQFYKEGRVPEFIDKPTEVLSLHLRAAICYREGNNDEAADLVAQADEKRVHSSGTCNGKPFEDFRDLDDLSSPFFEVLTTTGKYFWVPIERIRSIEFRKPERTRDLIWRSAHIFVEAGPEGEVYIPVLYPGSEEQDDPAVRLGRGTDWKELTETFCRGFGQRILLAGEEDIPILEIENITFDRAGEDGSD